MGEQNTILVIGATGNVGRHVVAQLHSEGTPVRALARDPDAAALPDGVDVVRGDLTEPEGLAAALDGVHSVFLVWPFYSADTVAPVVAAVAAHARRVVYLSAHGAQDDGGAHNSFGAVELAIEATGLEWTFLRPVGFAANALGWAADIRADRPVREPYAEAARSMIHERDIAAVAVRALTEDGHTGAKYLLTGPAALTQTEQVRTIGEVVGRDARLEELPREVAREQMLPDWGDGAIVDGALDYWASLVTDPEPVTDTVHEVTGTAARSFADWAADHAAAFRPSTAEVAETYVAAFRALDLERAMRVMSPEMVRVAPLETGGEHVEVRGIEDIMANAERLTGDYDIHSVDVDGPYLAAERFAVRFTFDETYTPTGKRHSTTKMSLYTVADGSIVREEVHYFDEPQVVQ
ncbi:uncharacterized protein YbjT (DUF2867 family) [Murinocardiopsis flavida]|uniref:Uncharacterized protein YbjT (DUF2867 family) n=2 Tax=Murinocardiopsis flavida TaxID=645275 RepID=A0A2P8DFI2_9ACTN|nr:uncharacterized protein YbjT (DUF2867 family) [Murinocardiopsis flavida]